MPIYEFKCPVDNAALETIAAFDDNISCPKCGYEMVRQFPTRNIFVWDRGSALVDTYDRDFDEMSANGEIHD